MYNEVYDAMVKAGVTEKLVEPMWVDETQQLTNKENAFGRKATHLLLRPDYVVFVDEVGCNTSQEGDGARGREKKIVSRGTVAKESATTNSNLWSVQQLKALVSYKKMKRDWWPQLKNKAQLLEKWEEVKSHGIPHLPSAAESQHTATEQVVVNEG